MHASAFWHSRVKSQEILDFGLLTGSGATSDPRYFYYFNLFIFATTLNECGLYASAPAS